MILKRRRFTRDFTSKVLHEIEAIKTVAEMAREHQLYPTLIGCCRRQHRQYAERPFAGNGNRYTDEARIAELERRIG
jgi:transposase